MLKMSHVFIHVTVTAPSAVTLLPKPKSTRKVAQGHMGVKEGTMVLEMVYR